MRVQNITITKYVADEGKVFDWKEPRYIEDKNGNQIQEHLYTTILFIGSFDSIDNYIEVEAV